MTVDWVMDWVEKVKMSRGGDEGERDEDEGISGETKDRQTEASATSGPASGFAVRFGGEGDTRLD